MERFCVANGSLLCSGIYSDCFHATRRRASQMIAPLDWNRVAFIALRNITHSSPLFGVVAMYRECNEAILSRALY